MLGSQDKVRAINFYQNRDTGNYQPYLYVENKYVTKIQ